MRPLEVGRRLLEKEARHAGAHLKKISSEDWQRVVSEYGLAKVDDLYAELGYGKWSARQVLAKLTGQPLSDPAEEKQPKLGSTVKRMLGMDAAAILVRGHDDLMVYRSKCCNPIPGDDIIGYVTRGRGIAVHSKNCPNVENLLYEAERRIPVEWAGTPHATFPVRLRIFTEDRPGMLAAITNVISEATPISELSKAADMLCARASKLHWTFAIASSSSIFWPASSASPACSISSVFTMSETCRIPFQRSRFAAIFFIAVLALATSGCKRVLPVDTMPLDNVGMNFDSIQHLKALKISAAEIPEIAKAKQAGMPDSDCVQLLKVFRSRGVPFNAGDAVAGLTSGWNQRGYDFRACEDKSTWESASANFRRCGSRDFRMTLFSWWRHDHADGKPVLSGASLAGLKNTGLRESTLLDLAQRGVPDSQADAIISARRHGASDAEILRRFSGS